MKDLEAKLASAVRVQCQGRNLLSNDLIDFYLGLGPTKLLALIEVMVSVEAQHRADELSRMEAAKADVDYAEARLRVLRSVPLKGA